MTAFTDFLANPGQLRRYANWLAEPAPVDTSTGSATTLRMSSRLEGFRTRPGDSPANALYRPDLRRGLQLKSGLWGGSGDLTTIGGASLPSEAELVFYNADGHYDQYRPSNGWSWGGRNCTVRFGSGWGLPGRGGFMALSDFRVFNFEMGEPEFGQSYVSVPIYGLDRRFDQPLTTLVYRGTNYCLDFAAGAYASMGTPAKLDITGNLTLEAWRYFDDLSAEREVFGWQLGATTYPYQWAVGATGAVRFRYSHTSGTVVTHNSSAGLIVTGRWYHLVVTVNGTEVTIIVYDGLTGEETVETLTQAAATRDSNSGGTFQVSINSGTNSMDGMVDEDRIWNTARTRAEIRNNRHGEFEVVPADLVGYWKHNDATGPTTSDSGSGTAAHGTLNGTFTWYHSLEGDGALAGKTKGDAWGRTEYQEAVLVDPGDLIYQVAGAGEVKSIKPYDGLSGYGTGGNDVADRRSLQGTAVASGEYRTCLAEALVKVGSPAPSLKFSVVVEGYTAGGYAETRADIIRRVVTSRGPDPLADPGGLDTAAFSAMNTSDDSVHGLYVPAGKAITVRSAVDQLIGPVAWWGFDFDSEAFTLADWDGPAVTADLKIPASRILSFQPLGSALRVWLVEVLFAQMEHHDETEIKSTLKTSNPVLYQRALDPGGWNVASIQDQEIRDDHPRAIKHKVETNIQHPGKSATSPMARDAAALAGRRVLDLLSAGYEPYRFRVDPIGLQLRLGETFAPVVQQRRPAVDRLGFDGTRNVGVLALDVDPMTYNVDVVGLG